jgi:hypothetical protein
LKIRQGFVTNSSSSSYIVVTKSGYNGEELMRFDDYKEFDIDLAIAYLQSLKNDGETKVVLRAIEEYN